MRILAIETATGACSVALIEAGVLLAERHELVGRGHAERLVPMIAELPDGGRADVVAVDCGPGSFTGVRVGLAAARGLAMGWGGQAQGFSSLALIAASGFAADPGLGMVTVAIAGGHGELFLQRFSGLPLQPISSLASLAPSAAAAITTDPVVLGAGADALVAARGWGEARAADPRAADVTLLPAALAALAPSPIYGRAPDARPAAA